MALTQPRMAEVYEVVGTAGLKGYMGTDVEPVHGPDELVLLSWIPPDRIPPKQRAYVRRCTDRAARRAGLGRIRVRFFGPVRAGYKPDFFGRGFPPGTYPNGVTPGDQPMTIGILASLRGPVVEGAIAHEVGHVLRHQTVPAVVEDGILAEYRGGYAVFVPPRTVDRETDPGELEADAFAERLIGSPS